MLCEQKHLPSKEATRREPLSLECPAGSGSQSCQATIPAGPKGPQSTVLGEREVMELQREWTCHHGAIRPGESDTQNGCSGDSGEMGFSDKDTDTEEREALLTQEAKVTGESAPRPNSEPGSPARALHPNTQAPEHAVLG